jgi:DNA-binding MarR family transcriptional regulator/N-acetylglutamate synthase-like GNAT family acetyltransferase
MPKALPIDPVESVRRFNRFYTRQIGLLEEGLHSSAFSLTEARMLYELACRQGLTATSLRSELGLDAGYLSRILKSFEQRGLIARAPATDDARQSVLTLTRKGRSAFAPLERASRVQVGAMLGQLGEAERRRLLKAMQDIQQILEPGPEPRVPYMLRGLKVGDAGWIARRQGMLYHEEFGWDHTFEALVAEILAAYIRNYDARHENAWIAEREGEIVGSVFAVRQSDTVVKLRLLYVEPCARGLGIGARLVDECIAFARAHRYKTLTLWTNDILVAARRIYVAAGFKLVAEERHHSFGVDLMGQNWDLEL